LLQRVQKRITVGLQAWIIPVTAALKHPDTPHALLRARRERPRSHRAAEQRYELAPLHSITSSVRAARI
jgi:hypothetical protein